MLKNHWKKLIGFVLLLLTLSACTIDAGEGVVENAPNPTGEATEISSLTPTQMDQVTPTLAPTQTNREMYDELFEEYHGILNEYKLLVVNEGKSIIASLYPMIESYYDDHGFYPESWEEMIPDYLAEAPKIFDSIDVQYNLSNDPLSYQMFFVLYPMGDKKSCYSISCAEGNVTDSFCELYIDEECIYDAKMLPNPAEREGWYVYDEDDFGESSDTVSRIFFMDGWIRDDRTTRDLLMADPDGSNITYITKATGVPAVSRDGTRLAVGCADSESICIYETANFPDYSISPYKSRYSSEYGPGFLTPEILPVDSVCKMTDDARKSGLFSMSWSADDSKLAYVCMNFESMSHEFCIHSFSEGVTECTDGEIIEGHFIETAEYSSVSDELVVTLYRGDVYVISETGEVIANLGAGTEATWSPDGEKVLLVRPPSIYSGPYGLAAINKDGSGFEWLIDPDDAYVKGFYENTDLNFSIYCGEISRYCGLTWSPDGRHVTFGASTGGPYIFSILQYDFATGLVKNLMNTYFYESRESTLPVWGDIPR